MESNHEVVSVKHFQEENVLEIVRRFKSNEILLVYPPRPKPDTLVKEVWGVENGILTLLEQVKGVVEPTYNITEKFVYEDRN